MADLPTAAAALEPPLLDVRDLHTYFFTRRGVGKAVNGVSFQLRAGETLGLVGESGCGKTMTALSILRLNPTPSSRIVGGQILFQGEDLVSMPQRRLRRYRGARISAVLQDPMNALNPALTVRTQLFETLRKHRSLVKQDLTETAIQYLRLLHIPEPRTRLGSFPHQLSGGMRQRVVGAIALSSEPSLLIADEPTTSLDVTVQAAYLRVLKEVQQRLGLAILFITHDFGIVLKICERVAVMYAGEIVETGRTEDVMRNPRHPYTEALINSVPDIDGPLERLRSIEGYPPSIYESRDLCPFAPRCQYRGDDIVCARCPHRHEVEAAGSITP